MRLISISAATLLAMRRPQSWLLGHDAAILLTQFLMYYMQHIFNIR
jgi:hypothetical protein